MQAYFGGVITDQLRWHPWTEGHDDPEFKYFNFVARPDQITKVLEDFLPYKEYEGVKAFYGLLTWLNGTESPYESSDSRFELTENNQKEEWDKKNVGHGSLMFLFRDLVRNLSPDSPNGARIVDGSAEEVFFTPNEELQYLAGWFVHLIQNVDKEFRWGAVEVRLFPTYYAEAPVPEEEKCGYQFVFRFWSWGDDEQEIFDNLARLNDIMYTCLKHVAANLASVFPPS